MPRPRSRRRLVGSPGRHREETSAGVARAVPVADRGGRLRWSLPQGHIGAEETIEEAAVHEVEETGVRITASLRDVGPLMLATGGTPAGFPRTDLFTGVT